MIKEITDILDKKNLEIGYEISFPTYKILPDEVKLALSVLGKHGMKISFILKDKSKQ